MRQRQIVVAIHAHVDAQDATTNRNQTFVVTTLRKGEDVPRGVASTCTARGARKATARATATATSDVFPLAKATIGLVPALTATATIGDQIFFRSHAGRNRVTIATVATRLLHFVGVTVLVGIGDGTAFAHTSVFRAAKERNAAVTWHRFRIGASHPHDGGIEATTTAATQAEFAKFLLHAWSVDFLFFGFNCVCLHLLQPFKTEVGICWTPNFNGRACRLLSTSA